MQLCKKYTIKKSRWPCAASHVGILQQNVCSTGQGAHWPPITCHEELTKYHGIAVSRLSKKGSRDFFGISPKVPPDGTPPPACNFTR